MSDYSGGNSFVLSGFTDNILAGQSILDVFVLQDILDPADAEKLKGNFKTNREIEEYLINKRYVSVETVNKAYSILLKLPYISLEGVELPDEVLSLIPEKLAIKYGIIPFSVKDRLLRIAVSRPADLLAKYPISLAQYFRERNLYIELFITGEKDFREAVKQYDRQKRSTLLLKKGSLPVVFLRNQIIPERYIKKFPEEFITKYRIVVFGQNELENFLVACEHPDSPLTQKIVKFIEEENDVRIELFATSADDINFALAQYNKKDSERPKLDLGFRSEELSGNEDGAGAQPGSPNKITLKDVLGSLIKTKDKEEFTMDDIPKLGSFMENELREPVAQKPPPEQKEQDKPKENEPQEKPKEDEREGPEQKKSTTELPKTESKPKKDDKDDKASGGGLEGKDLASFLDGRGITTDAQVDAVIKESYIPKIVAALVGYSLYLRASDVHIEPGTKFLRVRFRVDGVLREVAKIPLNLHPPIVSRIKILSRLKIDETRVPQDGRFDVVFSGRNVDVRVSVLPTVHGEKIVLRILDKDQSLLSLEDLGVQGSAFDRTVRAVNKPFGIILSTGPTGSGKSTTLYAIINRLSVPGINIVTLEDPVEYEIQGINQCQVKPEIGFTFAAGLRSVLRQDPNVIMVGEIRDAETAGMATHAALTGHLVLSTLHTNDASGALPRLINMGIEPFLITSSINLVIAQRLVRKICPKCKEELAVPPKLVDDIRSELSKIDSDDPRDLSRIPKDIKLYYGKGCDQCAGGFRGRSGLFEVMELNEQIEDLAVGKRPANEIRDVAIKSGMLTMKQDGILKALAGVTTIDEVLQATTNN